MLYHNQGYFVSQPHFKCQWKNVSCRLFTKLFYISPQLSNSKYYEQPVTLFKYSSLM